MLQIVIYKKLNFWEEYTLLLKYVVLCKTLVAPRKHEIGSFDFCADFLASVTHCRLYSKMGDVEICVLPNKDNMPRSH